MKLSDFIYPDMNIARSVNLERDHAEVDIIQNYNITARTLEILDRFASALGGERVNAWSLTGPYGMGKSAFVNYLLAVTGSSSSQTSKVALKKLKAADSKLHKRLSESMSKTVGEEGFFQVAVTAAYEPLNETLTRGLCNALMSADLPNSTKLIFELQELQKQKIIGSNKLFAAFQKASKLAGIPLLVIIDEFGKNLDYMSHHYDRGDLFIIQQLAEMRSVYLWVCLHQAFGEYVLGLSAVQGREWSKIQGRFEDISFLESTIQRLYLIKKALRRNTLEKQEERIKKWATEVQSFIVKTSLVNKYDFDENIIAAIYPLHPITAIALIELCRRFAQNDRTLLSFLCSGDKYALPAYLNRTVTTNAGKLPAVGLEHLYDYFFNNSTTIYVNRAESQRWVEIHDIIENAGYLSAQEQIILKNIGTLNLLSGTLEVKATIENISAVLKFSINADRQVVEKSINNLVDKGILLYREYAGEYRLWEGSDFDVYKAIQEKKAKLAIGSLSEILQKYLRLSSLVVSRHAYKTGTVRRFERRWLDVEAITVDLAPQKGFDGLFLYCFGTAQEMSFVPEMCHDGRPLLVAYLPFQATLYEFALEVAATFAVLAESPELSHDSVARKEVKFRHRLAEEQFRSYLAQVYSPSSEDLFWYAQGKKIKINNARRLSQVLSDLCDDYYCKCLPIGNEMINYDKISGAAARARRELVEAMVTRSGEEQLGLKRFGPEVAMYRSLLLAEGLHVKDEETGCWRFSLEGKTAEFKVLWEKIAECINSAGEEGVSVADIIAALEKPQFGMKQGPIPVYICLYLITVSDEIAVFEEGTYRPYLGAAKMALMLKRPDLFTFKRFVSTHVEWEVFGVYQSILKKVRLEDSPTLRNATMLSIVGPLIKFVNELPVYSKNTRQISLAAQRVRSSIQNSVEPMQLLFEELPAAVEIDFKERTKNGCLWQEELQVNLRAALQELEQAFPALNTEVQKTMLEVFGCKNLQELYEIQRERVIPLVDICDEAELKFVLQAFAREYQDLPEWVRGIAGIAVKKHIDSWSDSDFVFFAAKLRDYADRIKQLETLASVNGYFVQKDARLFSIMMPSGKIKREIMNTFYSQDPEVQSKVNEILAMPKDKSKAALLVLADGLFEGDESG